MAEATKAYTVVTSLKHDGERYKAGDKVQLTAAQAEQLIKAGAVTNGKGVSANAVQTNPTNE
ncbi:DUF7210 family protein [Alicyclobacillus ferrooxydans]|uniref:DUF7210 domain-containing protein n=1 Tax=Alicyclobacillus ferrooxydans TaxID=471514 RepID=A0A0P9CRF9_9BACL|nr:hypothetical protein [Alicyclobacillus ferrooxydans]KPV42017.1 hypothetical protein AN477_19810 [Alicyclobacillus ferrooxydans]